MALRVLAAALFSLILASESVSARLVPGGLAKLASAEAARGARVADPNFEAHWAVVVAGSAGWGNYRHQADACHAYHVLRRYGLVDERIVVMMYDDIANHPENPHPGAIFNRPGGPNIYAGVPRDYTGSHVNAETFLAVLEGNASAVAGRGSGKVVASGPNDRVFVFYSDHGAPGILGMPWGPFLYADSLIASLERKQAAQGFGEMVLYVEACESGSVFEGMMANLSNVYATTAANAQESSWATYCPGLDPPATAPPEFDTCLGDLYSVAWMEDSELADVGEETLGQQYALVRRRTSQNETFAGGSHVMEFGERRMSRELVGQYIGSLAGRSGGGSGGDGGDDDNDDSGGRGQDGCGGMMMQRAGRAWRVVKQAASAAVGRLRGAMAGGGGGSSLDVQPRVIAAKPTALDAGSASLDADAPAAGLTRSVAQHEADLIHLEHRARWAQAPAAREAAAAQLRAAQAARHGLDAAMRRAGAALLGHRSSREAIMALAGWPAVKTTAAVQLPPTSFAVNTEAAVIAMFRPSELLERLVSSPLRGAASSTQQSVASSNNAASTGGAAAAAAAAAAASAPAAAARGGSPVVDDWDCLRGMVDVWERRCGRLDQYGMRYTRFFANLCNAQLGPAALEGVLRPAVSANDGDGTGGAAACVIGGSLSDSIAVS